VGDLGLRDGGWLDVVGTPFTDVAKSRTVPRPNFGSLEIRSRLTIEGSLRSWAVTINQRIMLDTELIERHLHETISMPSTIDGQRPKPRVA
jgi:hypothetical protein